MFYALLLLAGIVNASPLRRQITLTPTATTAATAALSTTTFYPSVPNGTVWFDPPADSGRGRRLHPIGRSDLCITVQQEDGQIKSGASVELSYCFSNQDPFSAFQLWNISTSAFENRYIPLSNKTSWVLDALDNELVLNEVGIHDAGQKWSKSVDGGLSVGGRCLTVDEGSDPEFELPWGSVRDLEMEGCIGDAPNQIFYIQPYADGEL